VQGLEGVKSGEAGGHDNVAVGQNAFYQWTTGAQNIIMGSSAGYKIRSGTGNVVIGYQSHSQNWSDGNYNTALGYQAQLNMNGGANNISIGKSAGDNITTGDNNVVIGAADVASATGDDQLSISSGDGSPVWITGDSAGKVTLNSVSPAAYNSYAQFFYQRDDMGTSALDLRIPVAGDMNSTSNGYPMPADGVVKAVSIMSTGTALSGTGTQTFRVRVNGADLGSGISDFTFATNEMNNSHGTSYNITKTGLSFAVSAGDALQFKRSAGSLSFRTFKCNSICRL